MIMLWKFFPRNSSIYSSFGSLLFVNISATLLEGRLTLISGYLSDES
jgi:hypothetical protein